MESFLQTKEWADFKVSQGWQAHDIEGISILEKPLPFGRNFWYAPEIAWEKLENNLETIQKNGKNNKTIFTRVDIVDENRPENSEKLKSHGWCKAFEEIQPEWRQVIDLEKSEEDILSQMKPKGRYNIRVAQKHGVVVEKSKNIDEIYQIFRETAKRDGFEVRPKQYFDKLMHIFPDPQVVEIFEAKYNGNTLAAAIIVFYDKIATYLYGASSNIDRDKMAPYLLHWRVIQEAKKRDCKIYDLLAVSPEIGNKLQENGNWLGEKKNEKGSHKYDGITKFKEQFGGRKVNTVGSWDYVYHPSLYWLFKKAEQWRRK